MIAFLPVWILGVPLVLALVDWMATRSGQDDDVYDAAPKGRYVGEHADLRRGEASAPVVRRPVHRDVPANVS